MPNEHWCPIHRLHGEWAGPGVVCLRPIDSGTCRRSAIAPDVVEAIGCEAVAQHEASRSSSVSAYVERCRDVLEDKGWSTGKSLLEDLEALPRRDIDARIDEA